LKRHPLNVSFVWRPTTGPFRRVSPEQARSYDERGYLVLPRALPPGEIAELTGEIARLDAESRACPSPRDLMVTHGGGTRFVLRLAERSPRIRSLCFSPLIQDLVADFVGPDAWLRYDHSIYKQPHCDGSLAWHQDNAFPFIEPQQHITIWIALTDMTEENGCLWVQPGGHLAGTFEHRRNQDGWICSDDPLPDAIALPMPAGTLVVLSAVLPHSSGPNRTALERKAMSIVFIPEGAYTMFEVDGEMHRSPCTTGIRILEAGRPVTT
jgi:ectoine hydroxylase-related dioxygenase (phytanoyl-CoA dioxygenase family)